MWHRLVVLAVAVAAPVTALTAQETGTPVFVAPYRAFTNGEVGASFSDPNGDGVALEAFYRVGLGKNDLGFRLGAGFYDPTLALLGADFRARVLTHSKNFPLDGAITAGFGGTIGDNGVAWLPVGISLGRRFNVDSSKVSFVPYAQPVLAARFGDNSAITFTLGLGVDVRVSQSVDLRFSGGIGEISGVSLSGAYIW